MSKVGGTRVSSRGGARGCRTRWRQGLRSVAVAGASVAIAALGVASAAAAQPPGDAVANLAGDGQLEAALALLDTWLADHPDDPRMFPVLLKVVTAAPRQPTVDAVVERYRGRLASDQISVLRAAPADLAELNGGVVQALHELELPGIPDAPERRAALLLELGEVTWDTVPEGMPIVHAGLARSGEPGQSGLEPALRAAFHGSGTQGDGGAAGAVAGYGLVSLLAANGRDDEAAAILEQMRSRFPRSPEYALAAAELNAGAGLPRVVAFPSPAMLLGSLVATCLPPCPPPAAELLAGPAERGGTLTALMAEPPTVVAPPAAQPITRLMVGATSPPAKPAAVVAAPEPGPAAAVAPPVAHPVAAAVPPAPEPAVTVKTPASRPAAAVVTPAPARAAKRVVVVTSPAATPVPARAATVPAVSHVAVKPMPVPAVSGGAVAGEPVRVSSQPTRQATAAAGGNAETISRRLSALLGASAAARSPATRATRAEPPAGPAATPGNRVVRVSSQPDPAAFIVQTGAYRDADNALELEHELAAAGFAALARSYRAANGSIVHRVAVGGNMTRTKAEQLLARLGDLGYTGILARRDDFSYLPPPPPSR